MIIQAILQNFHYVIIAVMALILLVDLIKERDWKTMVCIAIVLVTFTLRALHIK